MGDRPLVQVGDIVNAEAEDYHRGAGGMLVPGEGDLHMRVTRVPERAANWRGDWLALRGVEKPLGQPEQPEMPFVVRCSALPGYVPQSRVGG